MIAPASAPSRQQELYWQQLVQLRVGCEYVRLYRAAMIRWETRVAILRAVASSGAIAAWAIFQTYPLLWGGIIASAQVADAVKDVFPLSARRAAAGALVAALEALFIDALHEWEAVRSGEIDDKQIVDFRRRLMERRFDAELKHFSHRGLPERADFMALAEDKAADYMRSMFGALQEP